ncbi:MAG: dephospho-CoA kinase [Proteobacteria bacterium]|nr:dephospho-CoA kinase [Pseudomonadota bacterium]
MPEATTGFIVGLTGGIGSGKSAAADMFAELGAAVVDADRIAHELTAPGGAAMAAIRSAFGAGVIAADGALDRVAMRRLAFSDAAAKSRLEGILHPLIRAESQRRCEIGLASGAPYVVLVVPLLVESGTYRDRVARVLVVDCAESTQVDRVMARNRMSSEEVRGIMATQATRSERLTAADDSVDNDSDMERLRTKIEVLHRKYSGLAAKKPLAS